jgi:hypothetical protein
MSLYYVGVRLCSWCSIAVRLAKDAKKARVKAKKLPASVAHHDAHRASEAATMEQVKGETWRTIFERTSKDHHGWAACESCHVNQLLEPHHLVLGERTDDPALVMALCDFCHRIGPESAHNAPRHFAQTVVIPWAKAHGYTLPNRKEYR